MFSVPNKVSRAYAFTLVELLVVIGIIALLISILLPSLNSARAAAGNVKCLSNLRQIGQVLTLYTNNSKGVLPYAVYYPQNFFTNQTTYWSLTLADLMNKGGINVKDATNNAASTMAWKVFRDDPAGLPITKDRVSLYTTNPLVFGVEDPTWGFSWKPMKISRIKPNTIIVFDGAQAINPDNAATYSAYSLDSYNATTGYNSNGRGVNDCYGIDRGTADNDTPLVGVTKDAVTTTDPTTANALRFRHDRNKSVNALFVDGHAASSKKGELTRANYRVPPR